MRTKIAEPPTGTALVAVVWGNEVYGVAADWREASCPVYTYGDNAWIPTGRQVADYRHSPEAALAAELRAAILASGETPDEEEVQEIVSRARAIWRGKMV